MHGFNSGSALFVNAEVDSMGGFVDGGVGVGLKTSPRRAAIEKAQAELRQEYDVREERRRELEFLEKGGNPLDFKFGNAASISVQSTSLTDQHHEQLVTSEAKGSFALTASPHGDSVDSSARPGAPSTSEPNTADNLLLFDGENEVPKGERRSLHLNRRNNITLPVQSSHIDAGQNAKESEDSAIVRPYARRNRSRPNHGPRGLSRDGKGLLSEKQLSSEKQRDHKLPSLSKPNPASVNGDMVAKDLTTTADDKLDGVRAPQTAGDSSVPDDKLHANIIRNSKADHHLLPSHNDSVENPLALPSREVNEVEERESLDLSDPEQLPSAAATETIKETCSGQQNGFGYKNVNREGFPNEGQNGNAALGMKNFDSQSSTTQPGLGRDVNNNIDLCTNAKNIDANGCAIEQTSENEKKLNLTSCEVLEERNKINVGENSANVNEEHDAIGCAVVKAAKDIHFSSASMLNEGDGSSNISGVHQNDHTVSKNGKENQNDHTVCKNGKESDILVDHSSSNKKNCSIRPQGPANVSEHPKTAQAEKITTTAASDCPPRCSPHVALSNKAHEDSILEEARIIEAKQKRIAELSIHNVSTQTQCRSHWDFVLEEMAWLANDFAQERLWKITAAAQLCHRAAFASWQRLEQKHQNCRIKVLAHTMAKAVMQFWHSVELLLDSNESGLNLVESVEVDEASRDERRNSYIKLETSKDVEGRHPRKIMAIRVKAYALRFLQNNRSLGICSQAEVPTTPDRMYETSTVDMSWDDHLTEEILFYTIPSNAMDSYRKSVESNFQQFEKIGNSMQEEVETSMCDTATEFGSDENLYDEDEAETSTYYLPGVDDGIRSSKSLQKKHKDMIRSYNPRPVQVGADYPYGHYASRTQPSMLLGKRPSTLNVVPITKRMRTSSRQRVVSPFTPGVNEMVQAQAKTDASSGDTNSFQDDQSTLHGGSQAQKSLEVESVRDFEKQLPYDCAETSVKSKKKKKTKNLGSEYDHGWQMESVVPNDQRDHSKKRMDSHHFESNGGSGLYGQNNPKKPKIMKQPHDNNFDQITPMSGSIPSPAASQMSNMSNSSKYIRIISGRDRARKVKALKMCAGQPGSGSSWSLFEDQALVVLVHDMGPNWELISDAINTSLQFKCIFRKPKECKERHKILMDRTVGDGADSAEDSGSSQSYPSTLPGIPKGSARQLFQRLQGPMEEGTLKSHFEKIIKLGQKQHCRRSQNDSQDLKQIVNVHNSHVIAVSQVCPTNLNGSPLTPLDLCDANASTTDAFPHGYQGSHAGGLASPNQSSVSSLHPTPGANTSLPGSSGMVLGSNLSPGHITGSIRDSRYGVPRTSPLPVDEQQRMQYNQMLSGRNIQQSSISVSGSLSGNDRGVRMLPGGSSMGMMAGTNRSMAMSRPGFQGMGSSSMRSSGSMLSSAMAGMPNPVNTPSGVGTGQGNSMLRPREGLHAMKPGHNPEHQRQVMVPELQMQPTQGNSQGIPAFNGLSSAFTNQTTPAPVQAYPGHAQQPLQMSQQQSHLSGTHPHPQGPNNAANYAIRLAKERQLQQQQRYLQQQQQQQFAASGALMPHVQAQSQIPISSPPLQNNSQVQSQNSSQQVSHSPVTPSSPLSPMSSQHQQQKHHLPHGFSRNSGVSALANQTVKQRQRQPMPQQYQQTGRQHPNQKQHSQSQPQAKLLKGIGRGNVVAHHNLSVDPSHLSGLSLPPGSQTAEKGNQMMHMMQGQSSKPLASAHPSNHSQLQQKMHSGTTPAKQLQPMISPDDSVQAQALSVPSGHVLSPAQPAVPPAVVASNHHQLQLQPKAESKQINQTQSNVQRMLQRQVHSESPCKSQSDPTQADQPAKIASQVCTSSTMTDRCNDLTNVVPAVPTVSSPWKTSEPHVSNLPNPATLAGNLECTTIGSSAGVVALPNISQGLSTRQSSVSMPSHAHNSGARWQQQLLPIQQSSTQPILSQQSYQSLELQQQQEQEQRSPKHLALPNQPQQQVQHIQTGQSGLFMQPPNSKVE